MTRNRKYTYTYIYFGLINALIYRACTDTLKLLEVAWHRNGVSSSFDAQNALYLTLR